MDPVFPKDLHSQITRSFEQRSRIFSDLWRTKKLPDTGWDEKLLEELLHWVANLDTNNSTHPRPIGAGEREGRVVCPLVKRLHMSLSHGMGRSGNLTEVQPKAVGSSMLAAMANELALQAIQMVVPSCRGAMVTPQATGMSMALVLLAWRKQRPTATKVIWSRIDQKSCLKCILLAGLEPIVIEPIPSPTAGDDSLITDLETISTKLMEEEREGAGGGKILCVITTTSCFAPRAPDDLAAVGELCSRYGVLHLVNNAYGLQSQECCRLLESAGGAGKVDCFVQSSDKNFQVPVGGSIIATFKRKKLDVIAAAYPGRASIVPSRDLLLTLLHQGRNGLENHYHQRNSTFAKLKAGLATLAEEFGERLLNIPTNVISLAMTVERLNSDKQRTLFGAMLFSRGVSGARVVVHSSELKEIGVASLKSFGSHHSQAHEGYLNVACAIGMTESESEALLNIVRTVYGECAEALQ